MPSEPTERLTHTLALDACTSYFSVYFSLEKRGMFKPISLKTSKEQTLPIFSYIQACLCPTQNQSWFPDSVLLQETAPIWFSVLS